MKIRKNTAKNHFRSSSTSKGSVINATPQTNTDMGPNIASD